MPPAIATKGRGDTSTVTPMIGAPARFVLLVATFGGCATGGPPAPERPFVPAPAEPAARAGLLALEPRLDEHFSRLLAQTRATGLMVGIVLGGELTYVRGFGTRDLGSASAVDQDTVFRIASMTKSFTAAAVLKLRDEARLDLDAPVARYLPELASLRGPTTDSPPITVRHLLTHASGLAYDDAWGAVTFGMGEQELLRSVREGLNFADVPGAGYAYSNLGYALLGLVVERVSGLRFRHFVTTRILRPLDMNATVWEASDVPPRQLAQGYRREEEQLVPEPRPSDGVFDAAGGLYSSLRDYSRFVALHLAAYPARDGPETGPLRRSTLREMHAGQRWSRSEQTPVARRTPTGAVTLSAASYGYGWQNVTTCAYEGIVQHGGYEPGYWSSVHMLPRHGLGIVTFATTEAVGFRAFSGTLALLREGGLLEDRPPPAAPGLADAREAFLRLMKGWDAALAAQVFDANSLKYAWMRRLPQDLATLSGKHGACRAAGPIRALSRSHGSGRLSCERGGIDLTIYLSPVRPARVQQVRWTEVQEGAPADPDGPCS
jgi:CubicO group peptidase (beta-lactamase class C family)